MPGHCNNRKQPAATGPQRRQCHLFSAEVTVGMLWNSLCTKDAAKHLG